MAADGLAPWSRWDAPGFQYVSHNTLPPVRVYDYPGTGVGSPAQIVYQNAIKTGLVEKRINNVDPSFYDCVYSVANSALTVTELCYKDIGCCHDGCCSNSSWHEKYGWAVALIVIFCIIVIVVFVLSMLCWLLNRSKDKQQRKELIEQHTPTEGLSPAASQGSIGHQHPGYYPYGPPDHPVSSPPPPSSAYPY